MRPSWRRLRTWHPIARVRFPAIPDHARRVDAPDGLTAATDAQDLDVLAGNPIDNATRHAVTAVRVTAAGSRRVTLTVSDDGPGIPATDRARATAPGIWLDECSDGHGFGVVIARKRAALYGGAPALDDAPGGVLLAGIARPYAG